MMSQLTYESVRLSWSNLSCGVSFFTEASLLRRCLSVR